MLKSTSKKYLKSSRLMLAISFLFLFFVESKTTLAQTYQPQENIQNKEFDEFRKDVWKKLSKYMPHVKTTNSTVVKTVPHLCFVTSAAVNGLVIEAGSSEIGSNEIKNATWSNAPYKGIPAQDTDT